MNEFPKDHPAVTAPDVYYREERANAITHGLGLLLGLVALPFLLYWAWDHGSMEALIGCGVFGASIIALYAASTLYHSIHRPRLKHVLRIIDHICIYFLIAGTYTPFMLLYLKNEMGTALLSAQWGLTVVGIGFKAFFTGRFERLSLGIYLLMGWMVILAGRTFFDALPSASLWLIAAGGVSYSLGVIFYRRDDWRYNHAIWHLFVLGGTACHFAAVAAAL